MNDCAAMRRSPATNAIEMPFAKLKMLLHRAAEGTIASVWDAIDRLLDDFSAAECSHYVARPKYGSI